MSLRNRLHLALRSLLDPLGIRVIRISHNRVRGVDLLRDLVCLLGPTKRPVIFDVGANDGETVRDFLTAFPSAQIVAFEPHQPCYRELMDQFSGRGNVRVENTALGDRRGQSSLNTFSGHRMNSLLEMDDDPRNVMKESFTATGIESVRVETLDEYFGVDGAERIDVLKIDTQGFDLNVLKGASTLLQQQRVKAILLEANFVPMYLGQPDFAELHRFVSSFGYHLVGFYNQTRIRGYTSWCDVCYVSD